MQQQRTCSTEEVARKSTMGDDSSACTSTLNAKRRPSSTRSNSTLQPVSAILMTGV